MRRRANQVEDLQAQLESRARELSDIKTELSEQKATLRVRETVHAGQVEAVKQESSQRQRALEARVAECELKVDRKVQNMIKEMERLQRESSQLINEEKEKVMAAELELSKWKQDLELLKAELLEKETQIDRSDRILQRKIGQLAEADR